MTITMMAALAALWAAPALAQEPAAPAPLLVALPELANSAIDPTCGGQTALTLQAVCVVTTQGAIGELADRYNDSFVAQGWLAATGGDNRVVYVKRRPEGGCDAFQLLAFADESRMPAPGEPAYVAFAAIPGDVCATPPAAPATPAPAQ